MTRQTATVPRLDVPGPPGIPLLGSALDLRRDLLATLNRPTVATVTSFVSPIHPAAVPPPGRRLPGGGGRGNRSTDRRWRAAVRLGGAVDAAEDMMRLTLAVIGRP